MSLVSKPNRQYVIGMWTKQSIRHYYVNKTGNRSLLCEQNRQYVIVIWTNQTICHCYVNKTGTMPLLCEQNRQYVIVMWTKQAICHCYVNKIRGKSVFCFVLKEYPTLHCNTLHHSLLTLNQRSDNSLCTGISYHIQHNKPDYVT